MPGCPDARTPRCPDAPMPGRPDAPMPRCPDARMQGCKDARMQGCPQRVLAPPLLTRRRNAAMTMTIAGNILASTRGAKILLARDARTGRCAAPRTNGKRARMDRTRTAHPGRCRAANVEPHAVRHACRSAPGTAIPARGPSAQDRRPDPPGRAGAGRIDRAADAHANGHANALPCPAHRGTRPWARAMSASSSGLRPGCAGSWRDPRWHNGSPALHDTAT